MEVKLGYFKHVFVLESVYGMSTVCLTTLNQSKLKVAYSGFLILVYTYELIWSCLYGEAVQSNQVLMIISRSLLLLVPLQSLTMGISDYKSKISSALNLEAMEGILDSQQSPISGKRSFKIMTWSLDILIILALCYCFIGNILKHESYQPITKYLTTFHYLGMHLLHVFPIILFLTKAAMIQREITKGFLEVNRLQQGTLTPQSYQPSKRGRRRFKAQTEPDKQWSRLSELQGSLHRTESMILDCYWMQIVLCRLILEVTYPTYCIFWIQEQEFGWRFIFFLKSVFSFLGIVYAVEKIKQEREKAITAMNSYYAEEGAVESKRIKHQILAKIHRSRVPFSCALFDVDYALLLTVLENFIFVVTAIVGNLRSETE